VNNSFPPRPTSLLLQEMLQRLSSNASPPPHPCLALEPQPHFRGFGAAVDIPVGIDEVTVDERHIPCSSTSTFTSYIIHDHPCRCTAMPTSSLAGVSSDEFGNTPTISQSNPPSLPTICAQIHDRLEAFLTSEPTTGRLRGVQEQSRLSLRIIDEALQRYR
jgi:hypothetical protein